jgi:hypothetical protein
MLRWTGGWTPVLAFNCIIVIYYTIIGFGIGGYASIRTFVDKVHQLGAQSSSPCTKFLDALVTCSTTAFACGKSPFLGARACARQCDKCYAVP